MQHGRVLGGTARDRWTADIAMSLAAAYLAVVRPRRLVAPVSGVLNWMRGYMCLPFPERALCAVMSS